MDTLHELDKYMKSDSKLSLDGMATTLGINFAITFGIFLMFIILRPNHSLVYAPRYKYATKTAQPPPLSHGIFSWCGPVLKANEQVLLPMIGYDALLFIRFMRMLRRLLYWMTAIGVCILIPINIVATSKTGEWPPNQGVDFLSISTINYYDGKFHSDGNLDWYWAHTVGTWLFSLLIYRALHVNYRSYVKLRRHYFESREYQRSMLSRTLLILNVPSSLQSDEALARWVSTLKLKYQPEQVCIGRRNNQLARFVEEHEAAVRKLEILLSSHLQGDQLVKGKRPMIRIGGRFFGMCGGRKVDAIEYYTERVQSLTEKINNLRSHIASNKPTNYGWMSFTHAAQAHAVAKDLDSKRALLLNTIDIDLAPQPKDIIWSNLSMNQHVRRSKRLVGSILFYGFVFLFFIPSSLLSASSNVKSMIRIFPNGDAFIKEHRTFVSLLSSYFAPVVMALFFFILPKVLRILSQQQGYLTDSSLDRQVLSKLYIFFIVNHLLVFTISSTLLGMYSQISAAVDGTKALTASAFFSTMAKNLTQVAKNICDVSTFWVNYVSLKGLGVIMDLAQVFALVSITLRKFFTRPSPRQLQEFTRPSPFDYSLFYNVLIFFFTIGLVYSVIAPLVLPFTLIYFMLATMVFRYLLMYVYVTNVETGGQIWRVLVNRLLFSTILFQIVMILVLNLKGATGPAYSMIPLPIFTAVFKLYCKRRFDPHVYYYTVDNQHLEPIIHHPPSAQQQKQQQHHHHQQNLGLRFGEPAFLSELPIPMVHERVKHLLPRLYGQSKSSKSMTKTSKGRLTRKKTVKRLSVIKIKGDQELQFQSVAENELDLDESTEGVKGLYKFDDDDASSSVVEATTTISTSPASLQTSSPLLPPSSHPPSSKKGVTDKYAPTRPLISQEDEEDEEMDLEWYARGRRLEDSTNVIEMAHLYHDRQLERGPGDVYRSRGYK